MGLSIALFVIDKAHAVSDTTPEAGHSFIVLATSTA